MFVELLPLLRNRTVSLSVAVPANGDSIVLTIMPKVTDEKADLLVIALLVIAGLGGGMVSDFARKR